MKAILFILPMIFISSGCTMISPIPIPEVDQAVLDFDKLETGETEATFALSKIVQDIERGAMVIAYPNSGVYEGDGTNCNMSGGAEYTYTGSKRMLGNWSTELGDVFYEDLTGLGYSIAGDPADIFNQQTTVASSEYLIGGRLVDLKGNYCQKHHWWDGRPLNTFSGETYVKIEWSVLNTLTKNVIINKTTEGYGVQEKPIVDGVYSSFVVAFSNALQTFATDEKLRAIAVGEQISSKEENESTNSFTKISQGEKSELFSVDQIKPYIVTVRIGTGHGSGVIIGKDGFVITNSHVVGSAESVQIVTSLGLEIEGKVVALNKQRDVALIKIPMRIREPISISLDLPQVGSDIFAVGSPLNEELALTVTKGISSAVRKDSASGNFFIQGDVAISPGSSGGPLFDKSGNVIGIAVAGYSGSNASGLNLFIPIEEVFKFLNLGLGE
jgi:serine protease Do